MTLEQIEVIAFALGGVFLSMVCNQLLLKFSESLGIRNKNDVVVRWSNQSKPSLGGVSFFVVFIFATFGYLMMSDDSNIFHNARYGYEFAGLFIAGSLAFLMGLADDAYNTRPFAKLFIQIACGVVLLLTGTIIDVTHVNYVDAFLTVLWVVVVMNSLNMLDNMDGITGTTVVFILLSCLFSYWFFNGFNSDIWSLSLLAVLGSLVGFLRYNINPSRLFMGDAGSQFIGLFVAFFGIKFLLNVSAETYAPSWTSVLITLTAFTGAAADTLTVVINRLKKGKSPMVGGKDHTTHHLAYSGKTDKQVWMIFFLIGLVSSVLCCFMLQLDKNDHYSIIALLGLYFFVVFFFLYRYTIRYKEPVQEQKK
jgi:UDP-GlcNAc:undecaprenyl-phosphate GlcNAc-1-phosphate transferase